MRSAGVAGALVVLLAGVAGCTTTVTGTASPAVVASPSPSTAAPSPVAAASPEKDQLADVVVQPDDLPQGWSEDDSAEGYGDLGTMVQFAGCMGFLDPTVDLHAVAVSPAATQGRLEIDSVASSFPAQDDVDRLTRALADPRAAGCFTDALRQSLSSDADPTPVSAGAGRMTLTPGNGGGPAAVVATASGSVPLTYGSTHFTMYIDYVFLAGRLSDAQIAFLSAGSRVPTDVRTSVVAAVAQRLAAL